MNEMTDINFILTPLEWNILLAGKGINNVLSIQQEEFVVDEKGVFLGLHHMYQQHLIDNDASQEAFAIDAELEQMLTVLTNATRMLVIREGDMAISQLIYCGTRNVCVDVTKDEESRIRLSYSEEDIGEQLCELTIPEKDHHSVLDEEELLDRLLNEKKNLTEDMVGYLYNLQALVELVDLKSKQVAKRTGIYKTVEDRIIIGSGAGALWKKPYTKQQWKQEMEAMIKE